VGFSVDAWASSLVGRTRKSSFSVNLSADEPLQQLAPGGLGLVNPLGAVISIGVMDKGPLAPERPLREAQMNTVWGGCEGPPPFGPLACRMVAVAQHLPPGPAGS
jgi:hypothetical protein